MGMDTYRERKQIEDWSRGRILWLINYSKIENREFTNIEKR